MKFFLVKTPSGRLVPASDEDREKIRALRPGDMVPVKIGKPRNGDHHRRFMALLTFVAEHHPTYRTVDPLLIELKMRTGHYDHYIRRATGEVVYIPKSIDFESMDELDFVVWSKHARQVIYDEFLHDFTERDKRRLSAEIDHWLAWT